ncbi:MAG: hypothetical protein PHE89_06945 [Alphaproteobacteria bacterium]|nr:hypothetical protein [Alphaproteobacteria bacterium]
MFSLVCLLAVLVLTTEAFANPACAVCTVAVGASLEVARRLGVDDCVVGVWAGALLTLLGFWMLKWFEKKNINFWGRKFISVWGSVAMIGFMYVSQMAYAPKPILIFYLDPFLFSVIVGALGFILPSDFYQWMKAKNGGRAHFPFEKVALPVGTLLVLSFIFNYYKISNAADVLGF